MAASADETTGPGAVRPAETTRRRVARRLRGRHGMAANVTALFGRIRTFLREYRRPHRRGPLLQQRVVPGKVGKSVDKQGGH